MRHHIWTYAPNGVTGWTLYDIPLEEVFFFIIQTYNTSLIYLTLTRRLVLPTYLGAVARKETLTGALILLFVIVIGIIALHFGDHLTYLGLIITWAGPLLLIQW